MYPPPHMAHMYLPHMTHVVLHSGIMKVLI
jgi:hypothetical protein